MSVPGLTAAPSRRTAVVWWRLPAALWWRSLPFRVIASVLVASLVVLVLSGFLLMQQATSGVMKSKQEVAENEARQAVNRAQQTLNNANLTGDDGTVDTLLYDLANGFANRGGGTSQYEVVVLARSQTLTAGQVAVDSIPSELVKQVNESNDLLITPTEVHWRNGQPAEPGLAAGSALTLPGVGRYQMYLIFPLTQEVTTLRVLRNAVVTTGAILIVLLTLIAALVSRQVVTPVRAARQAAESLASGNLHDRMQVRGTDDLARLAVSMNYMASELQKQINTLEELSAVQQRFVSDVSHELRTPLTTVRMAAEVLHDAREDFDPIAARSTELLQNELDRFESLLSDLLEISRFDAGAAELALSAVDLRGVVARVVEANAALAASNRTTVVVHATGEAIAEVDVRRIERILRNLLVNAIEHAETNPIEILIAGDEEAVAVAVRDHGVGFQASQAKQVFHRFWRADPARARTVGGTGLGLSISMEDANLHGGWLTAWGRPGQGAQFRLTLPRTAGTILQSSPLPMVPRDYLGPSDPVRAEAAADAALPGPTVGAPETLVLGGPLATSGSDQGRGGS
ncbi:two-component system, OmpR family, sensor histidine kinase MtrB [Friedmanniella luteola]|uniref:Sensor histidine kinase MtrB n=1 Tax=Friedmanniella luteola TaxID=546871 RepID=A0A1H1VUT2_9ACTN|nr:MtrAB system histidine kinase MtrB [Friedmanniella luteola]SDS88513.1 two-component system, OmpR family, sensor histidine kinase MtrB [Friedmanniella luteola]